MVPGDNTHPLCPGVPPGPGSTPECWGAQTAPPAGTSDAPAPGLLRQQ